MDDRDKKVLEDIFGTQTKDPVTRSEGEAWAYGRSNFKPFRMQYFQCKESGNLTHEYCHRGGHLLLICKKYGGQCSSKKCREDRLREGGREQCTLF